MIPVEWDGDIKVAANGDALGMNRAALTAMRYAAHHEKQTEKYDTAVAVEKLFAGILRAARDLQQAAFNNGMRTSNEFAYVDFTETDEAEKQAHAKLMTLLYEAERSICRHLR